MLCSCLLFCEISFVVGAKTADLWTFVETKLGCIASWVLLIDPFDSLFLFSGASWDICSLEGESPWNLCDKLTRRHFLGSCKAGVVGTVRCFIFMMLHSISETPKKVLYRTLWISKWTDHRAYNSLFICNWDEDATKHFFLRKVWVLRTFHVWMSLF